MKIIIPTKSEIAKYAPLSESEAMEFVRTTIEKQKIHEHERIKKYGYVKPIISCLHKGVRIVAVKSSVTWSASWKTVPDFLLDYIVQVLGHEWFVQESKKHKNERHEIVLWGKGAYNFLSKHENTGRDIHYAHVDGMTRAYLILAYELFILDTHDVLQNEVVRRLKLRANFQGALHELFVASTMIKAGFTLEMEDEKDKLRKHVEFIATHNRTGQKIAVEAKSKHRNNVLGFKDRNARKNDNLNVEHLLVKAFEKQEGNIYAVFIDINLPYSNQDKLPLTKRPWMIEFSDTLDDLQSKLEYDKEPYNIIVVSNHPHHYNKPNFPDTTGEMFSIVSQNPKFACPDNSILYAIHDAAETYGRIPNFFVEVESKS